MLRRRVRRRKSETLTGQRIPIEIKRAATIEKTRRGGSLQDAYRRLARKTRL